MKTHDFSKWTQMLVVDYLITLVGTHIVGTVQCLLLHINQMMVPPLYVQLCVLSRVSSRGDIAATLSLPTGLGRLCRCTHLAAWPPSLVSDARHC